MSPDFLKFGLNYAMRSIWRNPRRTLLTLLTLVVSVSVTIIAQRYATAVLLLWRDGAADTGTAHAQIHRQGYWQKQEGVRSSDILKNGNPIESLIERDPDVEVSTRRLEIEGLFVFGERQMYFVGKGVEPENELRASPRLFTGNDLGQFVDEDTPDGIVVGAGLAETLGLQIGDEVVLVSPTLKRSPNGIDARIVGIVDANIPSFSKRIVIAPIKLLQTLIRAPEGYTELAVKVKPGTNIDAFVERHAGPIGRLGGELRGWWQIEPVIRNVERIIGSVVLLISSLLFLTAFLSVLNIVYMVIFERTVEVGTLMAIGATASQVRRIFSLEALVLGLLGGLGGCLVGCGTIFVLGRTGLTFESPFGSESLMVYPTNDGLVTLLILSVSLLVCWVSALAPSARAARVEPVTAFRGQLT